MQRIFIYLACCIATVHAQQITISYLFDFGNRDPFFTKLSNPVSIAVSAQLNTYVADAGKNRIVQFDEKGEFVSQIGGFGWEHGQFQMPSAIFVYNALNIFVADYENNRIERYDKNLHYISTYMNNEAWDTRWQFRFPKSVAASLHGDLFVIDGDNKRILKFNPEFEPQLEFGNYDWGAGALGEPEDIWVTQNDLVYVSDSQTGAVMVYDYYGNFLYKIGSDVLQAPQGVFVDKNQFLYVTDIALAKFFVFTPDGKQLFEFGGKGSKIGAFERPMDICVQKNRLYIVDSKNNYIQVFHITFQSE